MDFIEVTHYKFWTSEGKVAHSYIAVIQHSFKWSVDTSDKDYKSSLSLNNHVNVSHSETEL